MDSYIDMVRNKLQDDYQLNEEDYKKITQDIIEICMNIGEEVTSESVEHFLNEYIKSNAIMRYIMDKDDWRSNYD